MSSFAYVWDLCVQNIGIDPFHIIVELICLFVIIYLIRKKKYNPEKAKAKLSQKDIDEVARDWKPQPLVPELSMYEKWNNGTVTLVTSDPMPEGTSIIDSDKEMVNFSSWNVLGLSQHPHVKEKAIEALSHYGCGSCGPRGFYGTMDVHIALEKKLAEFMNTEGAVIYSSPFATIASAIPAFSSRNDLIFCDKGVNNAVKTGVLLSRSKVQYFEHNDMEHLERLLKQMVVDEKKSGLKHTSYRTYIVVEGLYTNFGDFCKLPELLKFKDQYKVRLVMDDSCGIGMVGKTGRGTVEIFGVAAADIDILVGSLANGFGSDGGFCVGTKAASFHQSLNSSGYVFSASSPPFLVAGAIGAVECLMEDEGKSTLALESNIVQFSEEIGKKGIEGLDIGINEHSPVIPITLAGERKDDEKEEKVLQGVVDKCKEAGILLTRASYVKTEKFKPRPRIRLIISAKHSREDITQLVAALRDVELF